jgi:hypothetical protein
MKKLIIIVILGLAAAAAFMGIDIFSEGIGCKVSTNLVATNDLPP